MNNCPRCKLNIKDDTLVCPLCHGVITREHIVPDDQNTETIDFYPDVHPAMRKRILFLKILCFIAVVAEVAMLYINFNANPEIKWSLITGVAMFYGCFTICVSVLQNRSLRRKILVQLVVGILVMFAMDLLIGYQGWSLEIGTPIAILSVQVLILILMLVYRNRWQSYLFLQVIIVLMSLFFEVLALANVLKFKVLTVVALPVTALILVALVLFGGRRAGDELKERFRI